MKHRRPHATAGQGSKHLVSALGSRFRHSPDSFEDVAQRGVTSRHGSCCRKVSGPNFGQMGARTLTTGKPVGPVTSLDRFSSSQGLIGETLRRQWGYFVDWFDSNWRDYPANAARCGHLASAR